MLEKNKATLFNVVMTSKLLLIATTLKSETQLGQHLLQGDLIESVRPAEQASQVYPLVTEGGNRADITVEALAVKEAYHVPGPVRV